MLTSRTVFLPWRVRGSTRVRECVRLVPGPGTNADHDGMQSSTVGGIHNRKNRRSGLVGKIQPRINHTLQFERFDLTGGHPVANGLLNRCCACYLRKRGNVRVGLVGGSVLNRLLCSPGASFL